LYSKNSAHTQGPHTAPRRAASARGFTLVETMVATVLLSMMILGILQVLVGSYRLSAKARYNDHARYIIKSFADQFLTEKSTDTTGATLPFYAPTSATGVGLSWMQTLPDGTQTPIQGSALPTGLQVPLSDTTTGEVPIVGTVSYQVWTLDPATGLPAAPQSTAAGSLLRADFTVTYPMGGRTISQTISVVRATP
jgi:prepilin-type N-terminal cleavage/methylation domain-containing protein